MIQPLAATLIYAALQVEAGANPRTNNLTCSQSQLYSCQSIQCVHLWTVGGSQKTQAGREENMQTPHRQTTGLGIEPRTSWRWGNSTNQRISLSFFKKSCLWAKHRRKRQKHFCHSSQHDTSWSDMKIYNDKSLRCVKHFPLFSAGTLPFLPMEEWATAGSVVQ